MTTEEALEVIVSHFEHDMCPTCDYSKTVELTDGHYGVTCNMPCAYEEAISILKKAIKGEHKK